MGMPLLQLALLVTSSWLLLLPSSSSLESEALSESPCTTTSSPCQKERFGRSLSKDVNINNKELTKMTRSNARTSFQSTISSSSISTALSSSASRLLQDSNGSSSSSSNDTTTTTTTAALTMSVNYGYYESWANHRSANCNPVSPFDIDVVGNGYTHLAYAFAGIDTNDRLAPWNDDFATEVPLYQAFNSHHNIYFQPVHTLIAVGGWTFTNPGTTTLRRFSEIAANATRRAVFAQSVVSFLETYGFDGIDLDWEFPGDASRGGNATTDYDNFPKLLQAIRQALDAATSRSNRTDPYLITMAVPIHTSQLAAGYNLAECAKHVDWINLMAYDIHGAWEVPKVVASHTDINVIQNTVKYMFHQGVPSYQLVLGLAQYGRTYELANRSCTTVGCEFVRGGPGGCAGETGFMPYFTIYSNYLLTGLYQSLTWNRTTESMEMVVANGTIFISLDTEPSFSLKRDYATQASLRGIMWWAVDQVPPLTMSTMTQPPLQQAADMFNVTTTTTAAPSPQEDLVTPPPFYASFLTPPPSAPPAQLSAPPAQLSVPPAQLSVPPAQFSASPAQPSASPAQTPQPTPMILQGSAGNSTNGGTNATTPRVPSLSPPSVAPPTIPTVTPPSSSSSSSLGNNTTQAPVHQSLPVDGIQGQVSSAALRVSQWRSMRVSAVGLGWVLWTLC